jgi:alkylation response protein AidB-like acyl-CoA dehydrogenase
MNFDDSPADATHRSEYSAWLKQNAPQFELRAAITRAEEVKLTRAWQAHKAQAGYAAFTWPRELGGRGMTIYDWLLYVEEESKYRLPIDIPHGGVDLVMPTLLRYAKPELYRTLAEPTRRAEIIWGVCFSEPGAGSDVTASRLKAVRDGDDWVLNGQKTWSSWARFSDWAITIARTDPTLPKQRGLSCFIFDMRTPGIEIRPIRYMEGEAHGFDEVFFTDVRIPAGQLVAKEGDGLKIFVATLAVDRFTITSHREISAVNFGPIFNLARRLPGAAGRRIDERDVRQRLADYYVDIRAVENLRARHLTGLARGADLGPETAVGKLVLANRLQEMAAFSMDLLGPAGAAMDESVEADLRAVQEAYFMSAGYRIGAGTDEIIRNSVGERVLGLPADIRTDKDVPFNKLREAS